MGRRVGGVIWTPHNAAPRLLHHPLQAQDHAKSKARAWVLGGPGCRVGRCATRLRIYLSFLLVSPVKISLKGKGCSLDCPNDLVRAPHTTPTIHTPQGQHKGCAKPHAGPHQGLV